MGDTHGLTTRREILKRGAIVGGGVLWVTPVVQTLGMGTAFAQPVSADPCAMELVLLSCSPYPSTLYSVDFAVHVPSGCRCNGLDTSAHTIYLVVDGVYDKDKVMHQQGGDWYGLTEDISVGTSATAVCLVTGDSLDSIIDSSNSFTFTQDIIANRC